MPDVGADADFERVESTGKVTDVFDRHQRRQRGP
jgi:hypothetical protein